jgi:glycosyltransferase involved in cell wall biosynthesis
MAYSGHDNQNHRRNESNSLLSCRGFHHSRNGPLNSKATDAPFMKILLINDYGYAAGGAEIITMGLKEGLNQRGHEVRIFSSNAGLHDSTVIADNLCHGTTGRWRTLLQAANFPAAHALKDVLRKFQPDVVMVNLYLTQLSPLILRELCGIPAVYYAQWLRAICPLGTRLLPDGSHCQVKAGLSCLRNACLPLHDWLPLEFQRRLDTALSYSVDRVISISRFTADQLATYGDQRFVNADVIHPGVEDRGRRGALSEYPTVLFSGRLVREKGAEILIRAFAEVISRIPRAKLIIAGDGPERINLESLCSDQELHQVVMFTGFLPNGELRDLMKSAWVSCVPSLWAEPFGFSAAEAQMEGVPVVASNSGGLPEIVLHGKTGMLFTPGDEAGLARCLIELLGDREKNSGMGEAARKHAQTSFAISRFVQDFESLFLELVSRAGKTSPRCSWNRSDQGAE